MYLEYNQVHFIVVTMLIPWSAILTTSKDEVFLCKLTYSCLSSCNHCNLSCFLILYFITLLMTCMFFKLWLISLFLFQKMTKKFPKNHRLFMFFSFFFSDFFFSPSCKSSPPKKHWWALYRSKLHHWLTDKGLGCRQESQLSKLVHSIQWET